MKTKYCLEEGEKDMITGILRRWNHYFIGKIKTKAMFCDLKVPTETHSFKIHEVQFMHLNNDPHKMTQFVDSRFYKDNESSRLKFMEDKIGFGRCIKLKLKLDYIMKLRGKDDYQQIKLGEAIQLAEKHLDKKRA